MWQHENMSNQKIVLFFPEDHAFVITWELVTIVHPSLASLVPFPKGNNLDQLLEALQPDPLVEELVPSKDLFYTMFSKFVS